LEEGKASTCSDLAIAIANSDFLTDGDADTNSDSEFNSNSNTDTESDTDNKTRWLLRRKIE
jgi:hypothetical protein